MLLLSATGSASPTWTILRARPLAWPDASAFYTAATHGEVTPAQRFMLERRSLNEMKERFRVQGRYEPPVCDRRLPSCLLLAQEPGCGSIVGCAGVELALVDIERQLVLRRSRSERLLRETLPAPPAAAAAAAPGSFGRRFNRPPVGAELEEELAALREQEAVLDDPAAARCSALIREELAVAVAALPDTLRVTPLLSCVAVAPGHRRRGVARELCLALQAEARTWGQGRQILAMVDEDNADAAALLLALGYTRSAFRDEGAVAVRPERPCDTYFDRRELEVLSVPMPQVGFERELSLS